MKERFFIARKQAQTQIVKNRRPHGSCPGTEYKLPGPKRENPGGSRKFLRDLLRKGPVFCPSGSTPTGRKVATENAEAFGASRDRGTSVPTVAAGASSGEDCPTHLGQK